MKKQTEISGGQATTMDQKVGRHLQWECAAHEAADEFFKKHSIPWTVEQRRTWIDEYLCKTPYHVQNTVRTCGVCSVVIAEALLAGRDPFACPAVVKEALQTISARISMQSRWRYEKTKSF